jgi:two-component system NtrC family sensor kinase
MPRQGGRGVAWQWRIRHKLMLGLGLVFGLMALLLGGTLNGLLFNMRTMKSIESKLREQLKACDLGEKVNALSISDQNITSADELAQFRSRVSKARTALDEYEKQLQDTLNRRRDPDKGFSELGKLNKLRELFMKLDEVLDEAQQPAINHESGHLIDRPNVRSAINQLVGAAKDLPVAIRDTIENRIEDSNAHYQTTMIIVISTTVFGVLLMISFLGFFYRWMFNPIRDLEQGVSRVAHGDFDHRIEVHSGDEMEELADAFNDMTGRLREIYRDLAHQVNERSRQLVRSERLASVGFLAAGVAHEINNPLASIAFCSEALESRLSGILAGSPPGHEVISKYLKMIQDEAFRCKAITQRLLEFSRTGERRRESVDLAELIQSVLDMVQHLQNYKGKQIIFEPTHAVFAKVNAQEIKSVVLNLVVNALDSMDLDGSLTIHLSEHDQMAEMVFADTGCGMTSEILENIFEPFFTRSRTGKGTGLGLSISHRVITQHGGEIEATSPGLNQGSTFTVRLPMHPAETVKEETRGRAAA